MSRKKDCLKKTPFLISKPFTLPLPEIHKSQTSPIFWPLFVLKTGCPFNKENVRKECPTSCEHL
jgi:hypothetical protein